MRLTAVVLLLGCATPIARVCQQFSTAALVPSSMAPEVYNSGKIGYSQDMQLMWALAYRMMPQGKSDLTCIAFTVGTAILAVLQWLQDLR